MAWKRMSNTGILLGMAVLLLILLSSAQTAQAHCDGVDGPVVTDAKIALERRVVTPVLKWVPAQDEPEVRDVFARTLAVRGLGPEARELADRHFFETLVRLHRAHEGAAFTGLKPSGAEVSPAIVRADEALETGDVDKLARDLAHAVEHSVREQFARTRKAMQVKEESVDAGREFVEHYVQFVHAVKYLHDAVSGTRVHGHATTGD